MLRMSGLSLRGLPPLHLATYSRGLTPLQQRMAFDEPRSPAPIYKAHLPASQHQANARATMLRFSSAAVHPQKRMVRQASCRGTKPPASNWRARRRLRVRAVGARLGLLLRLRVRLSGVVGLLLRGVEELGCRHSGGVATRWSSSSPRARGPAHCHRRFDTDQSSFYAEAIADCLEFIKSRSSYLEN